MPDMSFRRRFILNTVYFALILALVLVIVRYGLGLVWPFLVAFALAWVQRPIIRWLTVRCHIKYTLSAALCLTVFFSLAGGLTVFLAVRLITGASHFVSALPDVYTAVLEPALTSLTGWLEGLSGRMSPGAYRLVTDVAASISDSVRQGISTLSMKGVAWVSGLAARLPRLLISALITLIATVFMTVDFSRVTAFLMRQFPQRPRHILHQAKEAFVKVIGQYGKSYGIIMAITFLEILAGLVILRQDYALALAAVIAVFDIFPIVGAGLILVPWGVIVLLGGATARGIGLLALWVVVMVMRQILEPRVVGHQVGLHPLCTLIAMFVGSRLFGGFGLLGLPIAFAILKSLDDAGVIRLLKKDETVPIIDPPPK